MIKNRGQRFRSAPDLIVPAMIMGKADC